MQRDDSQCQKYVHFSMSKILNKPSSTVPKFYWYILNWFLNNKKIPSIVRRITEVTLEY